MTENESRSSGNSNFASMCLVMHRNRFKGFGNRRTGDEVKRDLGRMALGMSLELCIFEIVEAVGKVENIGRCMQSRVDRDGYIIGCDTRSCNLEFDSNMIIQYIISFVCYQRDSSWNPGILTILCNRLGDIGFLILICFGSFVGSGNLILYVFNNYMSI